MEKILSIIKKYIPKKIFKLLQPIYHYFMAWLAAFFYGFPSEKIIVIGVTGTTGKTTSTYLIAETLKGAGYKVGYTSTAMFNNGKKEWLNNKKMTMVGRFFTQKMLKDMVKNKCHFAIIETTSEGVVQFRHRFINYDFLVFTGLYPEHIESHGSFENYKKAKGRLFSHLKQCKYKFVDENYHIVRPKNEIKKIELQRVKKTTILNGDDQHVKYFFDFWADKKVVFVNRAEKFDGSAEWLRYKDVKTGEKGIGFAVNGENINLRLLGEFNAVNAMTAYALAYSLSVKKEDIKKGLEKVDGVAGRLEKIDEGQNFIAIVDYAFEPNAVQNLYKTIKMIPHHKIIHLLGSTGGGRDVARRPVLGEIAGKNADIVIVTNEDPYDDDPVLIIDQVALGAEKKGKILNKNLFKIEDRREAIKKAIKMAKEKDIVLITGKGSEQAICLKNGEKMPWDDRAVVRGVLHSLRKT